LAHLPLGLRALEVGNTSHTVHSSVPVWPFLPAAVRMAEFRRFFLLIGAGMAPWLLGLES
jgi:hypothetical protein